jgi:hypothetical protein
MVVRFRIRNAEEKQQLKQLVEAGYFWLCDTLTVEDEWPEFYMYFPSDGKVQGVSHGTFNVFQDSSEMSFIDLCKMLISEGVIG